MSLKSRLKGWHCSKGVNAIASKTLLAWFCISELFVGTEGRLSVVELIMPRKKMLYISLTQPTGTAIALQYPRTAIAVPSASHLDSQLQSMSMVRSPKSIGGTVGLALGNAPYGDCDLFRNWPHNG
jgi:hypothetical protein